MIPSDTRPVVEAEQDYRRPETITLGGRTLKLSASERGGSGEFYSYAVKLTPDEIEALAAPPAGGDVAGLAEVERLVTNLSASSEAVGIAGAQGNDVKRGHFNVTRDVDKAAILSAFATLARTLADTRAEVERLQKLVEVPAAAEKPDRPFRPDPALGIWCEEDLDLDGVGL